MLERVLQSRRFQKKRKKENVSLQSLSVSSSARRGQSERASGSDHNANNQPSGSADSNSFILENVMLRRVLPLRFIVCDAEAPLAFMPGRVAFVAAFRLKGAWIRKIDTIVAPSLREGVKDRLTGRRERNGVELELYGVNLRCPKREEVDASRANFTR